MPPLRDSVPIAIPTETRQARLITKATATQNTGPEFQLLTWQIHYVLEPFCLGEDPGSTLTSYLTLGKLSHDFVFNCFI